MNRHFFKKKTVYASLKEVRGGVAWINRSHKIYLINLFTFFF